MGKRPSVLLVDDEPELLRALEWQLEDVADVTCVASVSDALLLVEDRHYDIIVADLRLPDRWGDELLARVAASSPTTRRLLLTADSDPQRTVRELLELGVIEACYRKPHADGLIETIRAHADL